MRHVILPDRYECLTLVVNCFSKLLLNTSDFSFKPPRQPINLGVDLYERYKNNYAGKYNLKRHTQNSD